MPLDPDVPPHKTKAFWYIAALAIVFAIAYPFAAPSREPLWLQVVPSAVTSIIMICIGWFTVRRLQRGETRSNASRIILVIVAILFFILALIFKRHP